MIRVFSTILIAVLVLTAAVAFTSCQPSVFDICQHEASADEVLEPNCTYGGYTKHTCNACGYVWHDTFTEVNGECAFEVAETVASTCTELGYTKEICVFCGDEKMTKENELADHSFGEWELVTEPECEVLGLETRTCAECGHTEDRQLDYVHTYDEGTVTAPTCTEDGFITYTCTVCEHSYDEVDERRLGHNMSDWYVDVEQTCESVGVMRCECTECEYYETEEINTHHSHIVETVEPTHTTVGYTVYECDECGKIFASDYVEALGHDFGNWHDMEGAEGWEIRECECGHYEIRAKKK